VRHNRRLRLSVVVGAVLAVLALVATVTLPATAAQPINLLANIGLISLLGVIIYRTSRLPHLPRPTVRFWASLTAALAVYAVGMVGNLVALLVQEMSGRPVPQLGSDLIYPLAGLVTMYAMFQYPTTAGTRAEKITVALDVGIVLLGAASFIWYFSVSPQWAPELGWLRLSETLGLPVMLLVAGFGILRVAFVGVGVLSRAALTLYTACVGFAAAGTILSDDGEPVSLPATALIMLSQLSSLTAAVFQYSASAAPQDRPAKPLGGRRRAFSIAPYGALAAALGLLVVVLGPGLDRGRWGVLAGTGLLLCLVTGRQLVALRENNKLLIENRTLTGQLQHQAWHDELTGLANRAFYRRRVGEALTRFATTRVDTALLLVDLDDFKNVNDSLGHDAGDTLLCEVAARLTGQVRETDTVCRLGGDEFVILIDDIDAAAVGEIAQRLVGVVSEPVHLGGNAARVGASIGIAFVSDSPINPTDILRRADTAMYRAKGAGKHAWAFAEPDAQEHLDAGAAGADPASPPFKPSSRLRRAAPPSPGSAPPPRARSA
jgi:diguanylate cyclase (GGDEF)-like protein